ncbi:glycosyltransferase [Kineococcus rhizosphaerae]|uniref:Glycosyltransferase involved in cell wall biosynthesis n=1 Tax=Kineococcus rhizosphaerae TaxID=559628 RepID=A0A2T0R5D6_9ACTN|nr:glycosyltransferase [Kineococcus rhizosphaerae]PRY15981.1 glycosyltransferase involved in cell wall biosynthesis [Kineococcus rhizosphaerae]
MNRPLRVVHVITTLTTGGAERQLELLLDRSAAQARTLCLYEGGPVADAVRRRGHPVEVLGMEGWRKPLAVARLARRLRRLRPDVVHVHLLAAQLWGIPAARLAGVPVVVSSEHSLMADSIEGRPLTPWLRRLYRGLESLTDHTVAVSATTADRLVAWGVPRDRITVVDNGIDLDAARPREEDRRRVRAELGVDDGVTVHVVVGRLDPVKRVDEVLEALAPRLRGGGHVLLVAGAGGLRVALAARAEELGVAASVRWLGARDDVPAVLAAADVLVSASRDETFGLAVLEAVAGGLPAVFVQCPALEELGDLPDGVVRAAGGGPEALRGALDLLTARGLHRRPVPPAVVQRYDARRTAAAVDAVYEEQRARSRRGRPAPA